MRCILFVDDESQILRSVRRLFIETKYKLLCAGSSEEALKLMESEKVDLIISDMRMPAMDGYQLLQEVKKRYPNIIRIILSGFTDERLTFQALQKNIAKIYLFKPWKNTQLLETIGRIFETEELLSNKKSLELIKSTKNLPIIRSSYSRIITMTEGNVGMGEIASEIELDQSFTSKIVHIANSAFYGIKTGSVRQAAAYLGLQNTRSLLYSISIMESISVAGAGCSYIEMIWQHAFLSNKLLSMIYTEYLDDNLSGLSNSAGLLHNIGIILMLKYDPIRYIQTVRKAENLSIGLLDLEIDEFGIMHNEVGGYLLHWWELPFPIIEASLYHHQPFDERIINRELVAAVHIAQNYAWDLIGQMKLCAFYPEVFEVLKINRSDFEAHLKCLE